MLHLKSLLKKENIATNLTFTQFASKRLQGATKIKMMQKKIERN